MSDKMKLVSTEVKAQLVKAMQKHTVVQRKLYEEFGYGHAPAQFIGFQEDVTESLALDMIQSIRDGLVRNIELIKALRNGTVTAQVLNICQEISEIKIP